MTLRPHTKKFIGVLVILVWLAVFIVIAWGVGIRVLPQANGLVKFLYYAVAGMAWIVPIGLMLPWMSRDPRKPNS
jgi:hypothetical protein